MITTENLFTVINTLSRADRRRLIKASKSGKYEYAVLEMATYNVGNQAYLKLTNNFDKYIKVSETGGCILKVSEISNLVVSEYDYKCNNEDKVTDIKIIKKIEDNLANGLYYIKDRIIYNINNHDFVYYRVG